MAAGEPAYVKLTASERRFLRRWRVYHMYRRKEESTPIYPGRELPLDEWLEELRLGAWSSDIGKAHAWRDGHRVSCYVQVYEDKEPVTRWMVDGQSCSKRGIRGALCAPDWAIMRPSIQRQEEMEKRSGSSCGGDGAPSGRVVKGRARKAGGGQDQQAAAGSGSGTHSLEPQPAAGAERQPDTGVGGPGGAGPHGVRADLTDLL